MNWLKWLGFALAFCGMLCGLYAAYKWRETSRVPVNRMYSTSGRYTGGYPRGVNESGLATGLLVAGTTIACLNKDAAFWTAVSTALNGVGTVLMALSSP